MRSWSGVMALSLLGWGGVACGSSSPPTHAEGGEPSDGGSGGTAPVALELDAGFVDLPDSEARMFYSFRPADDGSDSAPLLVLFNGGPGAATTSLLLPFGTGPMTLLRDGELGDPAVANPASFTRFANLLYIDARGTGFSYGLGSGSQKCAYQDPQAGDALDFVYVLLEVMDRQPALANNPVVIVGESYGGERAAEMLFALQHYAVPADGSADLYPDLETEAPWLRARVQAHLDLAFPDRSGAEESPDEVASQFGHQLLIQPAVLGSKQLQFQQPYLRADPVFADYFAHEGIYDSYDIRLTSEEASVIDARAAAAMRDPVSFEALMGVAPSAITGLSAAERGDARRDLEAYEPAEVAADEAVMRTALGDTGPGDAYWLPLVWSCEPFVDSVTANNAFGDILGRTRTFITNARYDSVVYTPAIPRMFDELTTSTVTVDDASPVGAARPGVIRMEGGGFDVEIRFPSYEAGHAVTQSAGAELADDVEAWLLAEGVLPN